MSLFQLFIAILATVALFLHGLRGFSHEVRELGSGRFKSAVARLTSHRFPAFVFGALFTMIIQSSSAVTSITVALVDSGVVSFYNSLALMLGANVGTTATAWLVTLKIGQIAPVFIVLGSILGLVPAKIRMAGRSVFYFGLILFSLELISHSIDPIRTNPLVLSLLSLTDNHLIGVLSGILVTLMVQSSSVTTGLAVILTQQGVISTEGAIAIIVGSNLGTTSTALLASIPMNAPARLAAQANFFFNLLGIVVSFPFIGSFDAIAGFFTNEPGFQVAFAHLFFNVMVSLLFLPFLRHIAGWFERRNRNHLR